MPRPNAAFTLIEILAVLVLLGLMAAVTAWSWNGTRRVAQFSDAVQRLAYQEELAREHARRFGRPVQLVFDLAEGEVATVDAQTQQPQGPVLTLPRGYTMGPLLWTDQRLDGGQVALPCSRQGQTPSHALALSGPGGVQRWLVWAGLSGQMVEVSDEKQVQDILAAGQHTP